MTVVFYDVAACSLANHYHNIIINAQGRREYEEGNSFILRLHDKLDIIYVYVNSMT